MDLFVTSVPVLAIDWSVASTAYAAYIVAALLFILALAGLSRHESARVGNSFGILGMTIALVATIALAFDREISGTGAALLIAAMVIGAGIGLQLARTVEMTGMPELIALLHSFVGLAAVLVGWNGFYGVENGHPPNPKPSKPSASSASAHSRRNSRSFPPCITANSRGRASAVSRRCSTCRANSALQRAAQRIVRVTARRCSAGTSSA